MFCVWCKKFLVIARQEINGFHTSSNHWNLIANIHYLNINKFFLANRFLFVIYSLIWSTMKPISVLIHPMMCEESKKEGGSRWVFQVLMKKMWKWMCMVENMQIKHKMRKLNPLSNTIFTMTCSSTSIHPRLVVCILNRLSVWLGRETSITMVFIF